MDARVWISLLAWLGVEVQAQLLLPLFQPLLPPLPLNPEAAQAQYHAQDSLGQFNFGYSSTNQFREESRMLDGSIRGSYGYLDHNNNMVHVMYVADSGGFRVVGGNNLPTVPTLPQAVDYTPEVAAARAEFENTYNELAARSEETPNTEDSNTSRTKRSVLLPALHNLSSPTSLQVNVTEVEEVKDVISPANTQAVEYRQRSLPLTLFYVT